jgi:hypothetical protein
MMSDSVLFIQVSECLSQMDRLSSLCRELKSAGSVSGCKCGGGELCSEHAIIVRAFAAAYDLLSQVEVLLIAPDELGPVG